MSKYKIYKTLKKRSGPGCIHGLGAMARPTLNLYLYGHRAAWKGEGSQVYDSHRHFILLKCLMQSDISR